MFLSRSLALAATLALTAAPALAQGRPAPRPAPKPPAETAPAPLPIFPCRTAEEVCFLGIVVGSQLGVIYTNAPNGAGVDAKPVDVTGPDGSKLDLSKDAGRVVMLVGSLDPKAGITKAEIVEVAGPLASLAIKAQLGGGDDAGGGKGAPPRRR